MLLINYDNLTNLLKIKVGPSGLLIKIPTCKKTTPSTVLKLGWEGTASGAFGSFSTPYSRYKDGIEYLQMDFPFNY